MPTGDQSQHATEPATRDVYPYGLARHKGSLYLVALAVEHEAIRPYKVNRIDAAEITEFVFQRPKDFDMSAYLDGAFGIYVGSGEVTVVIKFMPAAARFVQESKWHASQVLTRERDGSLLARFKLSTTVEIKSWVLGFGARGLAERTGRPAGADRFDPPGRRVWQRAGFDAGGADFG